MSHERSETVQRPDGRWINVYGRDTPKAGQQLPGTPDFQTVDAAVAAAKQRSESTKVQRFEVTAPDGKRFEITAPEGATQEQALAYAQQQFSAKPAQPAPTAGERGKAALGGVNRGIAGLVGLPVDTAENLVNLGIAGVGTAATALGRPDLAPDVLRGTPGGSESVARLMEKAGIGTTNPRPDDPASRLLHTGGMIAGGSVFPGARPAPAAVATVGGAVAGETLGPEWTGVGAMAPTTARTGAAAAKNAVAARARPTVETFRAAGAEPSVGQATGNVFLHGLENLAAKFPGGAGVMKNFIAKQQQQIGAKAKTGVPAEAAGRAIEKGVTGTGGFLTRTRTTWQRLDDDLARKVGPAATSAPANTVSALDDLTRATPGAEKTTAALVNPKVAQIKENFQADLQANAGVMPFDALRALRSRVGSMLDDALVTGIPGGELKKLYGALSEDLKVAASQAGAGKEFARQNAFYRARMDRIESVLERVIGKGKQPEDIFKAINPTDPDQANKLRAVMRSLAPAERQVVTEAVVNRLGKAKPGKQDEMGEVFSSETFLTNWNKLSLGAKAQLFPNPQTLTNVTKIANAASEIRTGSGIYANPSGTAGSFAAYSVYLSPLASVAAGSVAPVVAAGSAAATAYVGAKMLTNPKVVNWLATPVNPARPGEAAAHLARLGVIYNQTDDAALKSELERFIGSAQQ
ncbi:MAG: hypothetical protein Q8P46_17815 [Hyphomicrobiales bacterium]|nr:hypothetical protein [Hyphomicrobiales bacterium]